MGEGRGATFLKGLLEKGADVIRAGELEGLLEVLQESVHDLDLIEGGRLMALRPDRDGQASSRTPGAAALLDEAITVSHDLLDRGGALACGRALPSRATRGAAPFVGLSSEALTLAGRGTVFAAAAARGRGLAVGIAVPLVAVDSTGSEGKGMASAASSDWAPEVRAHPGWLGPFFRAAARARQQADEELRRDEGVDALEVSWVDDARVLFGATTSRQGSFLVIDGLESDAPEELRAIIRRSASVAADGTRTPGEVLVQAETRWLPTAGRPGRVRVLAEPLELSECLAGQGLTLTLTSRDEPRPWTSAEVPFEARGPLELRPDGATAVAPALVMSSTAAASPGNRSRARAPENDRRRGHPAVGWLLFLGLGAVFWGSWRTLRGA